MPALVGSGGWQRPRRVSVSGCEPAHTSGTCVAWLRYCAPCMHDRFRWRRNGYRHTRWDYNWSKELWAMLVCALHLWDSFLVLPSSLIYLKEHNPCIPLPLSLFFPLCVSQEVKSITPEGSHNTAVIPPRF